ncbi:hypothetical protein MHBO_005270 [Bonamia ostreae]|uniref:SNF2 N-terminal domain-containing protein n=1 Tax=Bonamia ostreae TaxID=126728 RepID=A0ABV2AVF3_9EUKA
MGLGKTIQMIALIGTNDFGKGPTLIVCPVSVMNTWLYQIEEHVRDRAFRATIYHGADRNTDKSTLEDFDVVITSYSVVSFEYRTFGPRQQKLKASLENSSASSDDESDFEYSRGVHSVQWFRFLT